MIFNSNCSTPTMQIFSTWSTRPLLLKANSRKWRSMTKGRCHSLDSPLGVTLGFAFDSLTNFQGTVDELTADAKCSIAANTIADEPAKCAAAAIAEVATSTSLRSATYTECTKPRKSRFGPLFQVWHEWSSRLIVSQQAIWSWSRRPVMTLRTAELHLWQRQPRDY
jgi:hypothetical protein